MSQPKKHCSAIFLDGMVYVAGGVTADGQDLDIVEKYDPTTDKWDFVAHLNECKGMCIYLLVIQKQIYYPIYNTTASVALFHTSIQSD